MICISRRVFGAFVASFLFVGVPLKGEAAEAMSQAELLATIPGATLYGVSSRDGETRWAQAYSKGKKRGRISGMWGDSPYKAKWSVKGTLWCEDWGEGSGCWQIVRVGPKKLQAFKENGEKVKNPWFIK